MLEQQWQPRGAASKSQLFGVVLFISVWGWWLSGYGFQQLSWFQSPAMQHIIDLLFFVIGTMLLLWLAFRSWRLSVQQRFWHSQFESTFYQAAVGMAHVAPDGRFLRVNDQFALMLQYLAVEIIGRTFQEFTYPDDLEDDLSLVQQLANGDINSYELEKRYRRRDGSSFWANLSVSFHRDPNPEHCYFVAVIENIDQKKQALLDSQAHAAQVRLLLEATGDAIIGLNKKAEITFVNTSVLQNLGYSAMQQLLGMPGQVLVAKNRGALGLWQEIEHVYQSRRTLTGEADLFSTVDGDVVPVAYRVMPVPQAHDGTVVVICWHNIRERRAQQLKQQAQSYLLHRLLEDIELPELLAELVRFIEQQLPGFRGAMMLADLQQNCLDTAAAPSLPDEYLQLTKQLAIRYGNGSCGTAAATRQPVFVQDVRNDMLWLKFREAILPYDWLQACWSTPFFDTSRQLLGTFSVYIPESRAPKPDELDLIQFTVSLAAFLVERSQAKTANLLLSSAVSQSPVAIVITDIAGKVVYSNAKFTQLLNSSKRMLGLPLVTLLPEPLQGMWHAIQPEDWLSAQVHKQLWQWPHADHQIEWFEVTRQFVRNHEAQATHVVFELEDITQQRQAEQQWMESELRFRTLLDSAPEIAVQGYEADGTTFYWNKASEQLYGFSKEEAIGRNLLDLIIPAPMRDGVAQAITQMASTGEPLPAEELQLQRKNGQLVQVYSSHVVIQLPNRPAQIFCLDYDLTERKLHQSNLRLADAVFRSSQEGILITDTDRIIRSVNPAVERLFGYSEAELIGKPVAMLRSSRHGEEFYQQAWQHLKQHHYWQGEVYNRRKDGEVIPLQLSISAIFNDEQVLCNYAAIYTDLSVIRAAEAEMMFLTEHDELTNLPNRHLFLQQVEQAVKLAKRENLQLAVLVLDLDHFKNVNDSFGHQFGDQLLTQVAQRLKRRLREADLVARLGGDEFAILLMPLPDVQLAAQVSTAILEQLTQPFVLNDGVEVQTGASIGISIYPEHGEGASELLQGADAALYKSKSIGRNTLTFFSDQYTQAARDRLTLEAMLRKALRSNHLRVYYQPQLDIQTGRIIGAEALVRWQDPELGMIPPSRFIPVAEACGLIMDVGEFVLTETCRQGKYWLDLGLPRITLAVNVSPAQFRRTDVRAQVEQVLCHSQFPAHCLELELTESALMEQQDTVIASLNALRRTGVRLAIDDFGTGYSSLAYLKQFPLDVLKIDKKFIDDIAHNKDDAAIATAIIGIAHTLGFKVLAEGVETEQQLGFLRQHRCDHYQGYLYSPPIPAERFQAMLELEAGLARQASSQHLSQETR